MKIGAFLNFPLTTSWRVILLLINNRLGGSWPTKKYFLCFLRLSLSFIILSSFSLILDAQIYNIAAESGNTISTCSGTFYDSGGEGGNYLRNEKNVDHSRGWSES